MLLHNKHHVLISPADSKLIDSLKNYNIKAIFSEEIDELIEYEKYHADMQLIAIKNTAFIPDNSKELVDKIKEYFDRIIICDDLHNKYPENVKLNAALIGEYLFCKESSLMPKLRDYCVEKHINIINVNQGYTKCSVLVLNSKAIITSDVTINKAAQKCGIDALLISPGNIILNGADYGFIGGCSGVIGDTVYFFGDVTRHLDAEKIINFIKKYNMKYISLLNNEDLKDIGGFVVLD